MWHLGSSGWLVVPPGIAIAKVFHWRGIHEWIKVVTPDGFELSADFHVSPG